MGSVYQHYLLTQMFVFALQAILPLRRCPFYMSAFFGSHAPLVFPSSPSLPSEGRMGVGGLGMPLCCFPRVFLGRAFGARVLTSVSSVHSWTRVSGVALLQQTPATCSVPVGSPSSTLRARRGVGEGESSGAFSVLGCLSRLISARSARWWGRSSTSGR